MSEKPMILVLCTGNSARSQMAEGFLRTYKGERYSVASAGTDPKPEVHPLAVRVMKEVGIDIAGHRPKESRQFLGTAPVRHLLIVCDNADKSCPRVWPGAFTRTFMPFDDPAQFVGAEAEALAGFRRVRDQIAEAMKSWEPEKAEA
jgi:arsenate reductase